MLLLLLLLLPPPPLLLLLLLLPMPLLLLLLIRSCCRHRAGVAIAPAASALVRRTRRARGARGGKGRIGGGGVSEGLSHHEHTDGVALGGGAVRAAVAPERRGARRSARLRRVGVLIGARDLGADLGEPCVQLRGLVRVRVRLRLRLRVRVS